MRWPNGDLSEKSCIQPSDSERYRKAYFHLSKSLHTKNPLHLSWREDKLVICKNLESLPHAELRRDVIKRTRIFNHMD